MSFNPPPWNFLLPTRDAVFFALLRTKNRGVFEEAPGHLFLLFLSGGPLGREPPGRGIGGRWRTRGS